jgi:hypothetical protein
MISRAQEPEQLYAEGGITSIRQPFFLGKIAKKIGKGVKKVVKSPIGKAALIGGGLWGLNKWGPLAGKISPMFSGGWDKFKGLGLGKQALLGLGAAGMALPFMADEEEVVEELPWETTPDSIANIRDMTRNRDSSLAFLPSSIYAQPGYYNMAKGGRAGLMNGGGAAEAQAENMLKMEYQKYRNQGGTMSYQQFKMEVLKQAQGQGPMAQTQPQMMNKGGRSGYALGERVEGQELEGVKLASDPGMGEGPFMLEEFLQAVKDGYKGTYEDFINDIDRSPADYLAQGGRAGYRFGEIVEGQGVTDKMEEIKGQMAGPDWFTRRVEALMYEGYSYEEASEIAYNEGHGGQYAHGGRVGLLGGGSVPGTRVAGYTTPAGYNKFDYPSGGVRVGAANGGIMPLLDLGGKEKDYRNEGGFVGIGRKEKADDVPARLSKNEFVFTADAVRNAGGGDINAGAEVMENMMNHLEAGGQISEESQGLGGEEMISEEEMIEAPDGAQEMYEQQAMLQSRMA